MLDVESDKLYPLSLCCQSHAQQNLLWPTLNHVLKEISVTINDGGLIYALSP